MHPEVSPSTEYVPRASKRLTVENTENTPESVREISRLEDKIDDLAERAGIDDAAWQIFCHVMTDLRDHSPSHYAHGLRVGLYAHGIAEHEKHGDLKLPLFAGVGHDIGKVAVSRDILDMSGPLSEQEYEEVKQHTFAGYEILNSSDFPFTAVIAGAHHFYRPVKKSYGINPSEVNSLTNAEKYIASNMVRIVMVADDFDARMTRSVCKGGDQATITFEDHQAQMHREFPLEGSRIDWLAANRLPSTS